jgi:hypothetical protein
MYICMYVCRYVRMYVYTIKTLSLCMYDICSQDLKFMYVCMYIDDFIHVSRSKCMYVCMYVHRRFHPCIKIQVYVCMYVCMYVWRIVCFGIGERRLRLERCYPRGRTHRSIHCPGRLTRSAQSRHGKNRSLATSTLTLPPMVYVCMYMHVCECHVWI